MDIFLICTWACIFQRDMDPGASTSFKRQPPEHTSSSEDEQPSTPTEGQSQERAIIQEEGVSEELSGHFKKLQFFLSHMWSGSFR